VSLLTTVAVRYPQEDKDYCLPYAVASCLIYMGYGTGARMVAEAAPEWTCLCDDTFKWVCGPKGVYQLGNVLHFCLPHGVKKTQHERVMRHNWLWARL
jgi:hypothetical protein